VAGPKHEIKTRQEMDYHYLCMERTMRIGHLTEEELEEGKSEDETSSNSSNNESGKEKESDSGESNKDSNKSVEGKF
jgi:hypothetical protein